MKCLMFQARIIANSQEYESSNMLGGSRNDLVNLRSFKDGVSEIHPGKESTGEHPGGCAC